jgi:hypothetical protein
MSNVSSSSRNGHPSIAAQNFASAMMKKTKLEKRENAVVFSRLPFLE